MKEHYLKTELYDLVKSDSIIFDFLQNGSLDGIWYWDIDNPEHEWMSPKFWELFGYDPKLKKHLASEWQDMIFKEDLDVALDNFEKHYENPKHPYDQIVRYKHKDGSTVWVRCRGIMIRDDEGKPIRMLGAHTDITELKEISSKLEKANESLINMELSIRNQQKLEAIGTMASGVAHEINNPINGILNYGQIILDEEIVNDNIKGYAREIIGESKRIAQIVSSLLDFSRHNESEYSFENVENLISKTLLLTRTLIKNSNINLTVNIQENLPKIRCNFQQIQQVIMNLLSNAKDALNQRYPGYSKNKIISISCCQVKYKTEDYIQLIVEDYGSGISDRIIEKIFDPFFTTKPNHQGTGLGLYISYGIIKDHQGKLKVETKENEYTRFIINLPLVSRVVE